jgi:DNA-binding NtrC family response regulator
MPTLLLIDDNPSVLKALSILFSLQDYRVLTAEDPEAGLAKLANDEVDLVIQDMNFAADTTSGAEGEALFRSIRARHPDLPVILLTAWTHLDAAVQLVKAGAADYLSKPWDDRRLTASVQNLLELGQVQRELTQRVHADQAQRRALERQFDLRGYVWADPLTERVLNLACQVARADVPVLIRGPNGAGKEGIAEIIQANSAVKTGPMITLNCGALPAELIEAELFGADAGAYTGASKAREGKFEAADGGTLFLDEIGNLPLAGQMKLLRVLETGRFERLGSNRERQVRVRVISATNADLPAMIKRGQFREDLYYRLNLIEIQLPALCERPRDILPLARHFLRADQVLSESAEQALRQYPWPGNVRELKNAITRASLLARDITITAEDLHLPAREPVVASVPRDDLEPDREAIETAIARHSGVIAQAAAELGLSRQALYRRMDRLGIGRAP